MQIKEIRLRQGLSLLLASILVLAVLAACGGGAAETPTAEQTQDSAPAAEESQQEAATDSAESTDSTDGEEAVTPETEPDEELLSVPVEPAVCEAIDIPNDEQIPAVADDEWAVGPEDAIVTLIEYGDFQ